MGGAEMPVEFDKKSDIIYALMSGVDKKNVANVEIRSGFVYRVDVTTNQCVGFIIHHVSIRHPHLMSLAPYNLQEELETWMKLVNEGHRVLAK